LNYFQNFKAAVSKIALPEKFTFPFYYEPHPLAKIATNELQEYLENQTDFTHNFGLSKKETSLPIGKMFGVLVVKNKQNKIGYLAAFSGKLADKSLPSKFVPPVFNMRTAGSFYLKGEAEIDEINKQLSILKTDEDYISRKKSFQKTLKKIDTDLALGREKLKLHKKERKARKKNGQSTLNELDYNALITKLVQESFNDQFFYKALQEYYEAKIAKIKEGFSDFENKIASLKKQRKEKRLS